LSNPEEEMKILDDNYRKRIAEKITMGIKDFLNSCK
jgi:N-acetylmuramoyl-L-alanine amidase